MLSSNYQSQVWRLRAKWAMEAITYPYTYARRVTCWLTERPDKIRLTTTSCGKTMVARSLKWPNQAFRGLGFAKSGVYRWPLGLYYLGICLLSLTAQPVEYIVWLHWRKSGHPKELPTTLQGSLVRSQISLDGRTKSDVFASHFGIYTLHKKDWTTSQHFGTRLSPDHSLSFSWKEILHNVIGACTI